LALGLSLEVDLGLGPPISVLLCWFMGVIGIELLSSLSTLSRDSAIGDVGSFTSLACWDGSTLGCLTPGISFVFPHPVAAD